MLLTEPRTGRTEAATPAIVPEVREMNILWKFPNKWCKCAKPQKYTKKIASRTEPSLRVARASGDLRVVWSLLAQPSSFPPHSRDFLSLSLSLSFCHSAKPSRLVLSLIALMTFHFLSAIFIHPSLADLLSVLIAIIIFQSYLFHMKLRKAICTYKYNQVVKTFIKDCHAMHKDKESETFGNSLLIYPILLLHNYKLIG